MFILYNENMRYVNVPDEWRKIISLYNRDINAFEELEKFLNAYDVTNEIFFDSDKDIKKPIYDPSNKMGILAFDEEFFPYEEVIYQTYYITMKHMVYSLAKINILSSVPVDSLESLCHGFALFGLKKMGWRKLYQKYFLTPDWYGHLEDEVRFVAKSLYDNLSKLSDFMSFSISSLKTYSKKTML